LKLVGPLMAVGNTVALAHLIHSMGYMGMAAIGFNGLTLKNYMPYEVLLVSICALRLKTTHMLNFYISHAGPTKPFEGL
jgi:hypothetical protein